MTNSYIFEDKIQLLKSLNEKMIEENKMLDDVEIDNYDQIFKQKMDEEYTMGEYIILVLWDVEKEFMLNRKIKVIEKINQNFNQFFYLIMTSINEFRLKGEIEEFIHYASEIRKCFERGNNEKVNRYTKKN